MYHIIVNPASRSGKGARLWERVEAELNKRKVAHEVYFSKRAGFVSEHVREVTEAWNAGNNAEPLKIIVLGGDGTVNEMIQGIADFSRVELGYIPSGSSNDLARDLQLPKDQLEILDIILAGETRRTMDIGEVSLSGGEKNRLFAVSSGLGFDAAVCAEVLTTPLKETFNKVGLGKLIYLAIALKQLVTAKNVAANLYLDDSEEAIHIKKFIFAAAMVHRFEGGGFKFCPQADYTDGLLDICAVGNIAKGTMLMALPFAFSGKHYIFRGIEHYRAKTLRLEVSEPLWVHTDGEVEEPAKAVTMTCQAGKLTLLC
ncbi:MAG: diacylglycerol kinase family lipid kinase [Lachnospiraceae bacterium]|jgi:YegS/Rv2252/BmrU family lipid kinase|nr:diacylglycerol kinase family lipid kinase [Lachnospiraceae bacterium]